MAKKFITDRVFLSPTVAFSALTETLNNLLPIGYDPESAASLIRDNFELVQDETGAEYSALSIGMNDNGAFIAGTDADLSGRSFALVTVWDTDHTIPQPEGEPLAKPQAVYFLQLPGVSDLISNPKLRPTIERIFTGALLTSARKIAKADITGTAPIIRDRVSALLNAAAAGSSAPEKAWTALFPIIQATILDSVEKKAEALKAAGNVGAARALLATFSRARLDKATLKSCLSSEQAATALFPAMPQAQWLNILSFAIAYAPRYMAKVRVKDAEGNFIKDAEGHFVYTKQPCPLPPAIFQIWKDTRAQTVAELDETTNTFTFDGLTV